MNGDEAMKSLKSNLATAYPLLIWSFVSVIVASHQMTVLAMDGEASTGSELVRPTLIQFNKIPVDRSPWGSLVFNERKPMLWKIQPTEKLFLSRSPTFVPCSVSSEKEWATGSTNGSDCTANQPAGSVHSFMSGLKKLAMAIKSFVLSNSS